MLGTESESPARPRHRRASWAPVTSQVRRLRRWDLGLTERNRHGPHRCGRHGFVTATPQVAYDKQGNDYEANFGTDGEPMLMKTASPGSPRRKADPRLMENLFYTDGYARVTNK